MKKVLGIIASPRKLGNCEIIVKEISRNIPLAHELKLLRIHDFNLKYCKACYQCLYGDRCVIDDDLPLIQEAMAEADAFILAAPAYFLGPNSALKLLLDRGLAFYNLKDSLWGKPSLGIAVAGIEGKEGYTLLCVNSFLKCLLSDIKMSAVIYSPMPGEAVFYEKNMETAKRMGEAIFGTSVAGNHPKCNLCGGDSFRFLDNGEVRCLLCSNTGSYTHEAGRFAPGIKKGEHELFLTIEDALKHEEWLREMKKRFLQELPRIKEVRENYKDGDWIKPRPPIK